MQLNKFSAIPITYVLFFLILASNSVFAQFEVLPCDDPDNNGVGCYCETAGVLCTPDLLNGFEFAMSNTENFGDLGDGPGGPQDDLCPGTPQDGNNQGGVPNNVNFFAFVVWCEELNFDVLVTNCTDNPLDNFDSYGIQMALFGNCPAQNGGGWDPVSCITSGNAACFDTEAEVPTSQSFSATGLEIGATYYFMVDGCALSTCKVTIQLTQPCGNGEITPWDVGLTGPLTVCVGDTETYTAEDALVGLDGAEEYYYYVDGVPLIDGEELFNTDITWDTPGSYELCVDVSNLPCIVESDSPPQNCITVFVSGPGNGDITADPEVLCPDETSTISVSNNNPDPLLSNYIIIVGPDGTVVQVVEGLMTTLTYDLCGDFTAYYYSFLTSENPTIPSVGDVWTLPDCLVSCCSLEDVVISFEDDEDPVFTMEPGDLTIDCADDITPDEALTWTDNCAGTGTVMPVVVEDFTFCDGGTVERTWTFTDSCTNNVEYTQTITIDPVPAPVFINPPADSLINCDTAQIFVPQDLDFSNSASGTCLIEGTVSPTSVGSFDLCGSSVTYTWEYTDVCNRVISYSQVVTVEEVGAATAFINPPADITISCLDWLTFTPETLSYSNEQNGACDISGSVPAVTTDMHDPCGNSITYTWEFTDVCNRTINHTQVVTIEPKEEASFVDPPDDITIDCDGLQTFVPDVLMYTNNGTGDCLIEGMVDPVPDGMLDTCGNSVTYTWDFTDDCNRPITHSQTVTVEPIPEAVFINPPGNISIDCNELQTFMPAILTYTNGESGNCLIEGTIDAVGDGMLDTCGNSVTYTWDFTDNCGRSITHSQVVTVDPIPEAAFVNPPGNVSINCDELQTFAPAILTYTNGEAGNCLIEGMIDPVGDGMLDTCGNSVTYTWEFTDNCGRTISHSQTVMVEPIPEASFVNPPGNLTIDCDELQTFTPEVLTYTNGESGNCLIEGMIDPVGDGMLDTCGNSVTYTWEFTDQCGRLISHSQTVTVEPIPEATFINPPGNLTINCDELQTFMPEVLMYSNGGTGNCLIEGSVDPVGDGMLDTCGNSVTYTWEFTDQCSRPISHTQTVTVEPIPEASFVNPPADVTITCDELQTFTPVNLMYTNSGTGNCLISGSVDPVGDGTLEICGNSVTFIWEFTDQCGRPINHTQTVTVEPIPEASFVDPPQDVTINCDELQAFEPEELMYTNSGMDDCLIEGTVDPVGDGTLDICGNSVTYTWEFTDECSRTISHSQTVTVEPIAEANYIDPPGDITLNCDDLQSFTPSVLEYTNGGMDDCLISGSVDPVGDGTLDICGNSVTYTWEFTDDCGRPITHNQTVTVEPIAPPEFIDPPSDETVACADKPAEGEGLELGYTNGGMDACETAGTVAPMEAYNVTECGGTIVYTWEFTDDCDNTISYMQTITVEPSPQAQLEDLPPSSITIECNENTGTGPDLVVTNNDVGDCLIEETVSPVVVGDADICGGSFEFLWEFTDECGRTTSFTQTVNVNPAPQAAFDNLPMDIDVECSENGNTPENLAYSNGETGDCEISGEVAGERTGTVDYCGGILVDSWEFTDECGRIISTTRNVNVAPAPPAEYINPPTDVSVDCDNVNSVPANLAYNNGESGLCQISGVSIAVVSGSFDACGGELIYTWSFVDDCGRPISHSQNITVEPAADPAFIDPPADITIDCNETYAGAENLNYTNGDNPPCGISGVVVPTTDQVDNIITNTWELVLPCSGESLIHTQTVTLSITPDITISPSSVFLCLGDSYDLSEIVVDETNGTTINVSYHNAFPPTPGNEISSTVSPNSDFIYVINAVNEFGCEDFELFNVFVEDPPFAGDDQSTTVCSDGIPINLFDFIAPFVDQGGTWLDLDGIGANISNPFAATFNNVLPGNYNLYYVVYSTNVCDNDTMVLNIEVIDDVSFEILEVTCIGSNDFYEVYINSNGFDIQATEGDLMNLSGNEYVITNIPITTGVFISAFEIISGCSATEFIDIPNCDCPDIDPPTGDNISICVDDQPINIAVSVPAGMTANWYLEQNSSTPFLQNEVEITVQDSMAGIYSYFVETYDPATDCSSNVKLKIDLEINDLPQVTDSLVNICDIGNDGEETVSLQSFNSFINASSANTFTYYANLTDAQNGSNPLMDDLVLNLGSITVFVSVENSASCVAFASLDVVLNDLPEADISVTAPSCIGDEDGIIEITSVDVDGTMETSIDGVNYSETLFYSNLEAGTYTIYIKDENDCINTYEVEVPDGLEILFTVFTSECNDNGTNTDPSDDFYTINLLIENNNNNAGSYYVIFDGAQQYTFEYGNNESFQLPANAGNNITINISDIEFLCSEQQVFGPLNPCSTNCEVSIDLLEFECSNNGTTTDPSDDFYTVTINASSMNGAQNNSYNVFLDGVLLYNFMYGEDSMFEVPANGNNLNITCQDNEDVQCQISEDIGPLSPCSEGCQIDLEIVDIECSNNGTSTIQDDDFYTFTIIGNIINGSNLSQFELFVDGVSQGFFNYGEEVLFDVNADEMDHVISIEDSSNTGCDDQFTTDVLNNCSTDCEVILNSISEVCFDNTTPEDSSDDFYEITINASSVNGASNQLFNLYIDGTFIGDFAYDQNHIITIDADNNMHTITLQDSEELACELDIETSNLTSCSGACLIEISIENIECFDNGTATNIDDDYYELDLLGALLNGDNNTSFQLFIDGILENTYSYGEMISVTLPADGLVHTISIIDALDATCTFEIETEALVSCSTDCEIVAQPITYTCFDNNTPTDPSDDFIELVINASAVNGATTGMYNLYFDGVLEGIFTYGVSETFTLPAQGQTVSIRFQDSQDLQCELEFDSEVLSPCSDGCLIGLNTINIACFNNGTPTDVNDDYYEITVVGEVLNGMPGTSFELLVDNVSQGSYNYNENVVITIPADNSQHEISIVDSVDPTCIATNSTAILTSCSTDCEISLNDLLVQCFDNGTLDDPSDDFYEVSFSANAINGSSGFNLTISGTSEGNFNYGDPVVLNLPADGSNLIFILTDLGDSQCIFNQVIGPLDPCSNLCTIEPMIQSAECFDNGTPIEPTDDYWEIVIFVNPANGETAPTYDLSVDGTLEGTYNYSENITITIPADNGTHQIRVNDSDDLNCDAIITTEVLGFCSTPCEISASYDNVICDNNGTNNTSADDVFFVDLLVSNPSAGQFEIPLIGVMGNYNEMITVGPFEIANGIANLQIIDEDQNLCFIEIDLIPPAACSDCVQTVDAGSGGIISCETTEIQLVGTSSEVGAYSWYGPADNLVSESLEATAVSVGIYTFSVLFEDGCIAEDQVEVLADVDLPVAILTDDGAITCVKTTSVLDGSATGSTDEFNFYWFDEDGNLVSEEQVFETDVAGVYFLQVEFIDNNCKSALEAVVVEEMITEPVAVIFAEPSNVIDCVIESIILSTDQEENVNYIWSLNGETIDNTTELEIDEIGNYGLLAIDTISGCTNDADLIISSLVDYPNITLDAPELLDCDSDIVSITASSIQTGDNLTSYWQDEDLNIILENESVLEVSEPGEYFYTLIDNNNGCENTDSIFVEAYEDILDVVTIPEITYIDGESVLLNATVNIDASEIDSVYWSPDENMSCSTCLSTRIDDPTDSVYVITVVDIYGCQDTAEVRLIRKERPEIYIPNVLNLDSNSGNNTFTIYGNSEVERILKIKVFDRWGNPVYVAENVPLNVPGEGWDGTFKGKNVEQGVYVYIIEALLVDNTVEAFFGDLTVIR